MASKITSVLLFLLLVILSVAAEKEQQRLRAHTRAPEDGSDEDVTMVGASKSLSQELAACQIVQPEVRF